MQSPHLLPALTDACTDLRIEVAGTVLHSEELLAAASAVAGRVRHAGTVALVATPSAATVVGVVGCLLAGVTVVPVPPDAGPREAAHILDDSRARLLLLPAGVPQPPWSLRTGERSGDATRPGEAPRSRGATHRSRDLPVVPVDPGADAAHVLPDAAHVLPGPEASRPALVLYTSGTTGPPKGVVLSRAALAADLDALAEAWDWTPQDVLVHGLPLFHVHGLVLGVLGALRVGSDLVHTGRPSPEAHAAAVAAGGTLVFGVPTVWRRVVEEAACARGLRGARLLVSGSAPLPARTFAGLEALTGHRVLERYGMTETLITLSARVDGPRRPGRVGVPLRGVDARVVDGEGTGMGTGTGTGGGGGGMGGGAEGGDRTPVPPDGLSLGELEVRGPTLFDGYLGRPEATASVLGADGWFRTGDVAVVDPDGCHRIVGRCSQDLIKSGGYRIGAGEVEDALLAHPGVRQAAVVGEADEDLGQRVVAYVVADGVGAEELVGFVAATLSAHKRPRAVHLLEELPLNALGKVRKNLLGP